MSGKVEEETFRKACEKPLSDLRQFLIHKKGLNPKNGQYRCGCSMADKLKQRCFYEKNLRGKPVCSEEFNGRECAYKSYQCNVKVPLGKMNMANVTFFLNLGI